MESLELTGVRLALDLVIAVLHGQPVPIFPSALDLFAWKVFYCMPGIGMRIDGNRMCRPEPLVNDAKRVLSTPRELFFVGRLALFEVCFCHENRLRFDGEQYHCKTLEFVSSFTDIQTVHLMGFLSHKQY